MKKMVFVTAIFMFMAAAPVIAGTVTVDIVDIGGGQAELRYSADVNIIAFALDITVDNGVIESISNYFVGECDDVNKGYGIFPGNIEILDTGEVSDWGTPIASIADLPGDTKPGLGSNGVTIEMGALYTTGRRPSRTGTLCRLTVSADCNMTVCGNIGRGKVVQEDGAQATLICDGQIIIPPIPCTMPDVDGMTLADANAAIRAAGFTGTITIAGHVPDNNVPPHTIVCQNPPPGAIVPCNTNITFWEAYNYPTCWDLPRQCHADYTNDGLVNTNDWPQISGGWLKCYPSAAYLANACADYNRDGCINTNDWPRISTWWLKAPPADCMPGDPLEVFDPDPGSPPCP